MKWVYIISVILFLSSCNKEDDRYLTVSKIRSAAQLATLQTTIDKVVLGTQEKKILGFIKMNKSHFAAYTQAIITTGIDLTELTAGDVVITDKRIEILLPHVRVLDFSYPFSSYKIDSTVTRDAFLNKIDILDHEKFYMNSELDIRNNLRYTGIRQATENKTRKMMEGLLKNLGYEEIYVSFKEGSLIKEIKFENGIK